MSAEKLKKMITNKIQCLKWSRSDNKRQKNNK